MILKIFFSFIFGYKIVEIEGYYIERFLNNTLKSNIFLWNIKRKSNTRMFANVGDNEFEELRSVANNNQCILKVKKECGITNLWRRYKKRRYLIACLVLFIIVLFIISRFIWNIEVTGNKDISKNEIIKLADDNGLKIGKYKGKIDTTDIIEKIRIEREDISWIGIEIRGTNAIIRVVEKTKTPEVVNENEFCNIIAKKNGVITKIYAQNGTALVKDGDEVKKGDVLIAGWMEGTYTGKYFVNSRGSVKAKVTYSQSEKIYKKEIKRNRTERKESKFSIKINNFQINLFKRLSKFKKYDTIEEEKNLRLFHNFYIPITFIKYENFEINEQEVAHNSEEAKNIGDSIAKNKLDSLIDGEVVDTRCEITEKDDCYIVVVYYDVIEDIGTKEKI